jgi:endonuclease/exonuclease/phosphatase family metal-dependent hydrolase
MRVLSWNLYHGRDVPPGKHPLLAEFAEFLNGLEWDVALLQEAPPRWFQELQKRTGSTGARILTSRNSFSWLRGKLADWRPDLMKSSEGGSNQLLVRAPDGIADHHAVTLARLPERRKMHWAQLDSGICVANMHLSTKPKAAREVVRAAELAVEWSESMPLVFGGDLNLRDPVPPASEIAHVAVSDVDHVFVRGFTRAGEQELPDRRLDGGVLSDHAALIVSLEPRSPRSAP